MARVMITNGGPHPPEKWAMTTAEQVFDINDTKMAGDRLIQAQKFQLSIAEVLMPHHEKVMETDRRKLAEDPKHIFSNTVESYLDAIIKDIVALAKGTPWQDHFAKSEVQEAARHVIGTHVATMQHVERLWHADNHPDCEVSQSYKAMSHSA